MGRDLLRGESVYSVFIRNHSASGNIQGVIEDLDRIKDLGVTILWILPHYPIGKTDKKGDLGSPYAISDYLSVNPDIGGIHDFKELVSKCHEIGLKIIIDIVFNHTSPDSILFNEHPEWFLKSDNNHNFSKIPGWSDVIDLDFTNNYLRKYLIDVLHYWADLGIDGFRCDIAAVIPLTFWKMAKDTLNSDHKELIWIGVSADKEFISFIRHNRFQCHSDSELYNVFDILFDYDIQSTLNGYINKKVSFETFIKERRNQEVVYPADYLKLRFIENHDTPLRAATLIKDKYHLINWKSFSMFEKGIPLINAGEEYMLEKKVDMFSSDKIKLNNEDLSFFDLIKRLLKIEHMHIVTNGIYTINPLALDCVHIRYRYDGETLHGIFNFGLKDRCIELEVLKGNYLNIVNDKDFDILEESLDLNEAPFIFKSIP
ncbi:MAG: alpha-amylase family glycosyl hydrolase [Spirochaetaceae bacterium]